jgi:carboxypeptidase C (cathepsin A)
MYYQLFGAMGANVNQSNPTLPLLIWLQGGPGVSSMFGAFTEIGPIRVVNGKVKTSSYPWNIFGHLLFIDQPLNVGFSFYGNRTGSKQVTDAN